MTAASTEPTLDLTELPRTLAAGAAAGVAATVAMSALMLAFQKLGLLGRTPPRHIVEHTLERLRLRQRLTGRSRKALSVAAHLGFGATQGALYAVGQQTSNQLRGAASEPRAQSGIPFALGVWATSYAGWIPATGILPPPSRDRPGRPTTMILAHVVYGAVLAKTLRLLLPQRNPEPAA